MHDRRSFVLAYLLWAFCGFLGIHRFYLNRPYTGVLWLVTGGLFGVGWFFDLFWTAVMVHDENQEAYYYAPYSYRAAY